MPGGCWRSRCRGGGARCGEGGAYFVETGSEVAGGIRGRAQPFPGGGRELAPVGVVARPFEDLGGVAQLLGELGQYGVLLVGFAGGGQGLQEFVEGGGHRARVVG